MLGDSTPKIGQDVGPAPTDLWNVGGGGGAGATTGGSGGAGGGTADWLIPLIAMFAGSLPKHRRALPANCAFAN